jgi:hypothetical protein
MTSGEAGRERPVAARRRAGPSRNDARLGGHETGPREGEDDNHEMDERTWFLLPFHDASVEQVRPDPGTWRVYNSFLRIIELCQKVQKGVFCSACVQPLCCQYDSHLVAPTKRYVHYAPSTTCTIQFLSCTGIFGDFRS